MNKNHFLVTTLSSITLFAASASFAAEPTTSPHGTGKHSEMKMGDKMSCEGMKGMMGMMGEGMMGKGMMNQNKMMPNLPSGNEKLNAQMHAEMMQSMGNIMQKYADKITVPEDK